MSFNFTYSIENLGNIKKADVNIKPLTIIAGKNSTGKTFITKSLYTILNTVGTDHLSINLIDRYDDLRDTFESFKLKISSPASVDFKLFKIVENLFELISDTLDDFASMSLETQLQELDNLRPRIDDACEELSSIISERIKLVRFKKIQIYIDDFTNSLDDFHQLFNSGKSTLVSKVSETLDSGFKKSFQITNLNYLINKNSEKEVKTKLSLSSVWSVEFDAKSKLDFEFTFNGVNEIQRLRNIVFFDSPVLSPLGISFVGYQYGISIPLIFSIVLRSSWSGIFSYRFLLYV